MNAKLLAKIKAQVEENKFPVVQWAMRDLLEHVDKLEAYAAQLLKEIEGQKPVPLCVSKHMAPIGYSCSLSTDNCVACAAVKPLVEFIELAYPSLPSYLGQSETPENPCFRRLADEILKELTNEQD